LSTKTVWDFPLLAWLDFYLNPPEEGELPTPSKEEERVTLEDDISIEL